MKLRQLSLLAVWLLLGSSVQAQTASPDADSRKSGFEFMSPATQTMQLDDTLNPAMLWVKQGEALWQKTSDEKSSCVSCHGAASSSMRGVAARYPAWSIELKRPVNLSQRINLCRVQHQKAPAWRLESQELLSLETYVAFQSRGMPMAPDSDARLQSSIENGRLRYQQRMGQLDLSCSQCHDQRWGQRLGGSVIPQAYANAYPVYRLEWQAVGSLQRRLRNCINGVRAESFALGSLELVELELYLSHRSKGMSMETPAVRP
jgi:sulfur-oxidizing protein SoxA